MTESDLAKKNKSLKGRLLLSITSVLSITVCLAFGLFFYHSYQTQYSKLYVVAERTADINALTISAYVKESNSKRIKKIVEILKYRQHFSAVEITDVNRNIIAAAYNEKTHSALPIWSRIFRDAPQEIVRPILYKGQKVGQLKIVLSFDQIAFQLQRSLTFALGLFACMLFLVTLTVYFQLLRLVLTPLNKIIRAIQEMARGDLSARVDVQTNDELGLLAESFNKMSGDLRSMYEIIEEKVRQRTKELQETQTKQQASEAASKAKSQFLANMSHELRTPLNAIIGYSDILMEDAQDEERQDVYEDLRRIRTAGHHLLGLVNDILDISKIESGKIELYLEEFKVDDVLDEISQLAQPLMAKNNNTFKTDRDYNMPLMKSDYTKIKQILTNLISNASKFTHNGTVTLDVTPTTLNDVTAIRFRVIDTGIGMTKEQLNKVFQNFTQADESTSRKYGGTGLGLAITKNFVDLMHGTVEVSSEVDKGTTFQVVVPAVLEKDEKKIAS